VVNTTVVAGLVNGTTYSFRVNAVTGFGPGLSSTPTALVTPLGPAAAPAVTTVVAGDSQVSLSWSTPASNGSAITGYVLQTSADGGSSWTTTNLGVVNSTVVGGLVNGGSYVFKLAATTAFGTGIFSAPTAAVTPLALPGVPTGFTVTGGDRAATLNWVAPAVNGGRPISDYVVQYRDVTSGTWLTLAHPASTATSAVVSGLTNNATYVFKVAAVTSFGQGGFTADSAAITPQQLASAPTRLTGRAGDGTVALVWTAPRVTGGSRITDYVIDYSSDGGATWTRAADAVSAATRATVAVPNGVTHVFRVAAVTAGGVGAFSLNSGAITPFSRAAKPVAPTAVIGVGAGGTIALSWVGSPANAGGRVSDYVIQYRLSTSSRWVTVRDGVSATASATVSRLVAGRGYVFRVAAKNLAGQGAFSAETAEVIA
jgi:titin